MIELPMSGFAGREEVRAQLTELVAREHQDKALVVNIYGAEGTGKSTLVSAVVGPLYKKSFVVDIDLNKKHLRFPENALYAIRQEIGPEYADSFALFDLLYIMRVERIIGRLPIPASKFFKNNSEILNKIFKEYPNDTVFSRNLYKVVEEGVLLEWFETYARKAVMRMFQGQNQNNWESLINAFALGMRDYHKKTKKHMVIIIEHADDIFDVDDCGNSWALSLTSKAQCGKFIYISNASMSPQKTGNQTATIALESFSPEDSYAYFNSIGISREAVVDAIFDNSHGNPALMSYCVETSDLITESEGREPLPDIYEHDPEGIVHLHLSSLKRDFSTFAKVLSVLRVFNAELFEVVRAQFLPDSDKTKLPIKVFTDMRFCERIGGGYYTIQQVYKHEAIKALDPETIESVHYLAYQFHMAKLKSVDDYLSFSFHIYEALYHAKSNLDIDGFIMWFRGLEKDYLSAEHFNMWLGMYEIVRNHVSGIHGATHPETVALNDTLAFLYLKADRAVNAEETMQASLEAHIEHYGKNTAETVPAMNKVAAIYIQTGDYNAGEALLLSGLKIREDALGESHADVADSLLRLASLYKHKGEKAKMVEFTERASLILNQGLDESDDKRIEADEAMAEVYASSKNLPKAVQIYKKLSIIKKEKFGELGKETIKTLGDYAESVLKNGQPAKAVMLYEDLLERTKKTYGENSKASATAINDLAFAYQKNKEYDKAERMHKRALVMKDMLYGDNHPSTATSYSNYAQLKYLTGNLTEAEESYKKASQVYETVLGKVHHKTALGFNNLGFLTSRMGHFDEAERYYLDALESKRALGEDKTVSLASTLNNLGELMYRMGRKDEAKNYLTEALNIYKDVLGEEHNTTQIIAKNLASVSK